MKLRHLILPTALSITSACGEQPAAVALPGDVTFTVVSGSGQVGQPGTELAQPLVVLATSNGKPMRGELINFVVTSGGGMMFAGSAITDSKGEARDYWTLGTSGPQEVQARAVDPTTGLKHVFGTFTASFPPQAPPPDPVLFSASAVSSSQIDLTWSSGGGTTLDYRISYQEGAVAPATCAAGTQIGEASISGTTHSVTGLAHETQYAFRVCAINGNATPDVSAGATSVATTLALPAPPNPTNPAATPASESQIDLSWTSGGGTTSDYRISYQAGPTAPATCALGTQIGEGAITGTAHSVTGLAAEVQYSFRICAINANATPSVSSGVTTSATTPGYPPPPDPTGLGATPTSPNQIVLSWTSGGGSTADYRISYQAGATAPAACGLGTLITEAQVTGTSHAVTGLSALVQYSFRVCAINANASPDMSSGTTVSATTLGYAPPPNPGTLFANPRTTSSIELLWSSGGGTTSDYRISYQAGATPPATCATGTLIGEAAISGTSHVVSGLSLQTQYSFRVCAINANPIPDVSSGVTATQSTLGLAAPPNPTGPIATAVSESQINLSWTSGGGTTSDYRISYQAGAVAPATCAAGTTIGEVAITGTSHSVTGLSSGTQYSFRICAINANPTPDASSGVTATATTFLPALVLSSISVGGQHTCGLTTSGAAYCWGGDTFGQLGDAGTNTAKTQPVAVNTANVASGQTFTSISAGSSHTCALTNAGAAYCWGSDATGQLGNGGTNTNEIQPVAVDMSPLAGETLTSISAGSSHTCGRTSAGNAFCWGSDASGQLGNAGTNTNSGLPVAVVMTNLPTGSTFTSVSAGGVHTCGVTTLGAAFCWGGDDLGQIGDSGLPLAQGQPVAVNSGNVPVGQTFVSITTGGSHSCALTNTGAAFCWGLDSSGQLGDASPLSSVTQPVAVNMANLPVGQTFVSISAGNSHTCGLTGAGTAFCWGLDTSGQVGDAGANASSVAQPVAVNAANLPAGQVFASVSAGGSTTCGVTTAGAALCWGADSAGQLGNGGAAADAGQPVPIANPLN